MSKLSLVKPTIELKDEYLDMIHEWKKTGEKFVPWVLRFDTSDFSSMVKSLEDYSKGIGLQEGQVAHSTYWLINETKRVLGAVNIRHDLNDFLLRAGGHIGYGIRPSERRKGYATEALHLALKVTEELGINKVLVVCDKDNLGSARTIQKNGGVLESEELDEDVIVQRYWINYHTGQNKSLPV